MRRSAAGRPPLPTSEAGEERGRRTPRAAAAAASSSKKAKRASSSKNVCTSAGGGGAPPAPGAAVLAGSGAGGPLELLELLEVLEERLEHPRGRARGRHELVDASGGGGLVVARRELRLVLGGDGADAVAGRAGAQHAGVGRRVPEQLDVAQRLLGREAQ